MSNEIVILVVPDHTIDQFREHIDAQVPAKFRDTVKVLGDFSSQSPTSDQLDILVQRVIGELENLPSNSIETLFIDQDVRCDKRRLEGWAKENLPGEITVKILSGGGIRKSIQKLLRKKRIYWKTFAEDQLSKYQSKKSHLDGWLEQFNRLGLSQIGKRLAYSLRVIDIFLEVPEFLAWRECDNYGIQTAHCFFQDDDPGGSWVAFQQALNQQRPKGTVFSISQHSKAEGLSYPAGDFDELIIWEDGLWSGYEAVKRLRAIQLVPPAGLVKFRFAVVTDFGLLVVRHAIRELGLQSKVVIDTEGSQFVKVLREGLPKEMRMPSATSNDRYFVDLHGHVAGYIFAEEDWPSQDIAALRELGRQLVDNWVKNEVVEPEKVADRVEKFALGGGSFASSIAFRNSIPKVCIPLYWLDGPIEYQGRSIHWNPLLIDARRISDARILSIE